MNQHLQGAIDELHKLNLDIRQRLELAEAYIPKLNDQIAQLGAVQFLDGIAILGEVAHERPYSPGLGPIDSAQVYQAALLVPEGIGAAVWDTEEFVEHQRSPLAGGDMARVAFQPFNRCPSVVKALLLQQAPSLLEQLSEVMSMGQS